MNISYPVSGCPLVGEEQKRKSHQGVGTKKLLNERSPKLVEERTKSKQMKHRKRPMNKKLKARITQLKLEMEGISADQKSIREGQKQVREKFKEIESECAQLRKESNLISEQSKDTKLRLNLMFKILKARQDKDFVKANNLTQSLRELIARQDEDKQSNDKEIHPRLKSKNDPTNKLL